MNNVFLEIILKFEKIINNKLKGTPNNNVVELLTAQIKKNRIVENLNKLLDFLSIDLKIEYARTPGAIIAR